MTYDVTFARVVRTTKKPFILAEIKLSENVFYGLSFW